MAATNEKIVQISAAGPSPQVQITVGQAQWGKYDIELYDSSGLNPTEIGSGVNTDQVPDSYPVPKAASVLNGMLLCWEVKIAAYSSSPGQLYSVTVQVTQGGKLCPNGSITDSGALNSAQIVYDFVRFVAS